ncbi:MAG: SDR family NAD(P)-dependent oxidoreductase [Roseinatronobacter sp.]
MRVLLTGAASGLGAALARACLARGDDLVALDLTARPDWAMRADWVQVDLSQVPDWPALGARLTQDGPLDLVILNAGISATGPFERIPLPDHARVMQVNLHAPVQIVAQLVQRNALARGGRLVLVGSLSTYTGYPGAASYAASKDGLASLATSLRKPLRAQGVAVQLVCPGPMDTPHAERYAPKGADKSRRIAPEAVADAILTSRARVVLPGLGAKVAAFVGWLAPQMVTRVMGKVLFEKLRRS